uniref:Uncharacterized protein n=1 Tax=Anguilla anguilla TaxID=7936 RepID=A0A0E9WAX6_ANGAN
MQGVRTRCSRFFKLKMKTEIIRIKVQCIIGVAARSSGCSLIPAPQQMWLCAARASLK